MNEQVKKLWPELEWIKDDITQGKDCKDMGTGS